MPKFFRRGLSVIKFVPAVADLAAPTETELTAGTDLTARIAAISGFQFANTPIDTPDLASTFNAQIPGEDAAGDSSLTLYDSDDAVDDIRTALEKGTAGVLVFMPYGNVAGKRCESWPATSTGYNDQWSMDATAAQAMCAFAITDPPVQTAVIPTGP